MGEHTDGVQRRLLAAQGAMRMERRSLTWDEAAEVLVEGGDEAMPPHLAAVRYEFSCGCYDDQVRLVHDPGSKLPSISETEQMVVLRHGHGVSVAARCGRHAGRNALFEEECGALAAADFGKRVLSHHQMIQAASTMDLAAIDEELATKKELLG